MTWGLLHSPATSTPVWATSSFLLRGQQQLTTCLPDSSSRPLSPFCTSARVVFISNNINPLIFLRQTHRQLLTAFRREIPIPEHGTHDRLVFDLLAPVPGLSPPHPLPFTVTCTSPSLCAHLSVSCVPPSLPADTPG